MENVWPTGFGQSLAGPKEASPHLITSDWGLQAVYPIPSAKLGAP